MVLSKQTWSPEARPVTKSDKWDWRREDQTASSLERLAYQVFLHKCNVATAYLYCSNGSRLCLRVPEKSTGSYTVGETISWQVTDFFRTNSHPLFSNLVSGETCGMMVSLLLSLCRPNSEMSTPSINIRPEAGSINLTKQSCQQIETLDRTHLKRARVRELLPAPVRPTMPTLSPPWVISHKLRARPYWLLRTWIVAETCLRTRSSPSLYRVL